MVGFGETYFLANALRLGASTLEQALVVTLPLALGAIGPLISLRLLYRAPRRRPVVVSLTALQSAVLLAMAGSDAAGALTPARLIALSCLYQMCSQGANTAWSSWYGDLVPPELRGRYFARRNRAVHISTAGAVLVAGLLLQRLEPSAVIQAGGGAGFRVILVLAALARASSATLLARSPEPAFRGVAGPRRTARFLRTDRGSAAWRLLAFGAAVQLGTYVASPYFVPFMLQELRLTYFEYTMATLAVVVGQVDLPAGVGPRGRRPRAARGLPARGAPHRVDPDPLHPQPRHRPGAGRADALGHGLGRLRAVVLLADPGVELPAHAHADGGGAERLQRLGTARRRAARRAGAREPPTAAAWCSPPASARACCCRCWRRSSSSACWARLGRGEASSCCASSAFDPTPAWCIGRSSRPTTSRRLYSRNRSPGLGRALLHRFSFWQEVGGAISRSWALAGSSW